MRREHSIISEHSIQPVFFAPLLSDRKDYISGSEPTITGSMSSFDQNKGLFFNGSSGLKWSFSQLAFDPTQMDINTSFTLLIDYNRNTRSGHDWFFVLGSDTGKQIIAFLYEYNSKSISFSLKNVEYPHWTACEHRTSFTELNTQYNNSGFTYDGGTHVASRIINGNIIDNWNMSIFPTLTQSMYLYIGQASYSGDKMNGYLKNVRFYLDDYKPNMLM